MAAVTPAARDRILETAFALRSPIRNGLRPSLSPLQVKRLAPTLGFAPAAFARDLDARADLVLPPQEVALALLSSGAVLHLPELQGTLD